MLSLLFQSEVVRHKSTESISFPLCLLNFLAAIEWTMYGMAIQDKFVTVCSMLIFCMCVSVFTRKHVWIYSKTLIQCTVWEDKQIHVVMVNKITMLNKRKKEKKTYFKKLNTEWGLCK